MPAPGQTAQDGRNGTLAAVSTHRLALALHVSCTECDWVRSGAATVEAAVAHVVNRGHAVIVTETTPTLLSPAPPAESPTTNERGVTHVQPTDAESVRGGRDGTGDAGSHRSLGVRGRVLSPLIRGAFSGFVHPRSNPETFLGRGWA